MAPVRRATHTGLIFEPLIICEWGAECHLWPLLLSTLRFSTTLLRLLCTSLPYFLIPCLFVLLNIRIICAMDPIEVVVFPYVLATRPFLFRVLSFHSLRSCCLVSSLQYMYI